jgi:hypothetical protein
VEKPSSQSFVSLRVDWAMDDFWPGPAK